MSASYLDQRLSALGMPSNLTIKTPNYKGHWKEGNPEFREFPLFESDDLDNIILNYFTRFGNPVYYKNGKSKSKFVRKRLKSPSGDYKYWQPKGSGQFPYLTPGILGKYHDEAEIEKLILVEGEFKAIKGDFHGLDIIGLPSIHGFYDPEGQKGELHFEIKEILKTCKVKSLIFLVDADLLTIKWAEEKDIAKRQLSFYTAIKNLRESLQPFIDSKDFNLQNIFFTHIKSEFSHTAKGLDDLMSLKSGEIEIEKIKTDLLEGAFTNEFFKGFNITQTSSLKEIYNYLGLTDEKSFYQTYKSFIDTRPFVFKNRNYEVDIDTGNVKFVRHQDTDKFLRIGPNWFKLIGQPNKYGELEESIVPWNKSEIREDYKEFPTFIKDIRKFDAFCNEPCWNNGYKRVHNNCYNISNPITHEMKQGKFPYTAKFLKHVFQGVGDIENDILGDQFTVALDYLTIMFQNPKQMLPVPVLVSPEYRTGKTTFLKWLQAIFGNNCAILGNEQFKMKFNGHYISKFIIAIDEGFLEVDKKSEKERIKQLATTDTAYLENKGHDVKKFPYYGKLIICSNDADRVMKIDAGENRWFVVRVPAIQKQDVDPDLEVRMKEEIPAWLDFLSTREIFHPKEDRLWFKEDYFITDQFRTIVETTKNRVDRVFENWIKDQFLTYKLPVLRYPLNELIESINDPKKSKYRVDEIELKAYLKEKKGMRAENITRCKIPIGWNFYAGNMRLETPQINTLEKVGRPYVFTPEKWLDNDEMMEYKQPLDLNDNDVIK